MELHLQFGYGMMEHCRALISSWNGGTAILSPRDLNDEQLERLAATINGLLAGSVCSILSFTCHTQTTSACALTLSGLRIIKPGIFSKDRP
jgi:hypothetical protein